MDVNAGAVDQASPLDVKISLFRSLFRGIVTGRLGNNLRTIAPKHQGTRGSRADEKAGRINNIDVQALSTQTWSMSIRITTTPRRISIDWMRQKVGFFSRWLRRCRLW